MSRRIALLSATVCLMLCAGVQSADPPATQPVIGEMRLRTMSGMAYVYGTEETTLPKIKESIGKFMPALMKAGDAGKFHITGAPVMIYRGMQQDLTQPFTLEVGVPVRELPEKLEDFKARLTEPFRCAALLYTGPVSGMGKAFEKLFADVFAQQLTPTGEVREMYLYWESEESANNVIMVQVGVK